MKPCLKAPHIRISTLWQRVTQAAVAGLLWTAAARGQTTNVCDPCDFTQSLTNGGVYVLSGIGASSIEADVTFLNEGLVLQTGPGGVGIGTYNNGDAGTLDNSVGAIYQITTNSDIFPNRGQAQFFNEGLIWKSGGAGTSTIAVTFYNNGGSIRVDSGQLTLSGPQNSSNATFAVAAGAVLDLTGGNGAYWSGLMTGSGAGEVRLGSGAIHANPTLTMDFTNNLFQWIGGQITPSSAINEGVINLGIVTISGTNPSGLAAGAFLQNQGLVRQTGTGGLGVGTYNSGDNGVVNNLPGATYELATDCNIFPNQGHGQFFNEGLLWKSGGVGTSAISIPFYNTSGSIQVDAGQLTLSGAGSSSNGTFTVAAGAVLDLTGGNNPTWNGLITGTGDGQVLLSSGVLVASPSLTLDFTNNLFQWTGGQISGGSAVNQGVINVGILNISGTNPCSLAGNTFLENQGLVRQTGSGGLGDNGLVDNMAGGTYEFAADSGVQANGSFYNEGLVWKSAGTGTSGISAGFNNNSGLIQVDSGQLTLSGGGSSSNGMLTVTAGAVLDLTGGSGPTWSGLMTGAGAGQVLFATGTIFPSPTLTLDFTNDLFQWAGGQFAGGGSITNQGIINISGTNAGNLAVDTPFYNQGQMLQTGRGGLVLGTFGNGDDGMLYNQPGGAYEFTTDGGIAQNSHGFLSNQGLVWKSGGAGTSTISVPFYNTSGSIQVDTGQLTLSGGGSSSNGTFNVATGATLDLTGGNSPAWQGLVTGSGAGEVLLGTGTLVANPLLTVNLPNFQWNGGQIAGGTTVNQGVVNISSTNASRVAGAATFENEGLVVQSGSGGLRLTSNSYGTGSTVNNMSGGIYEFSVDSGVSGGGSGVFYNEGTIRKSAGTGTSTMAVPFVNSNGSIEVDSGQLSLNGSDYAQGTGSFSVRLAGTNAGQFGQLVAVGNASLGGPLSVNVSSSFAPAIGNQFQILSCSSLGGTFSAINVPKGISVNYSNTGVFLVVTSAVPAQIINPTVSNGKFVFWFETVSGQSYTVQRNDDLTTTNWIVYTNFTGDGSLAQVLAPATNIPRRFFRVSQP